jgi:hypothetical protein
VVTLGVDLHRLRIDVRLERVGRVGQRIAPEWAGGWRRRRRLSENEPRSNSHRRETGAGCEKVAASDHMHGDFLLTCFP